jgi:two-component system cell cycle response regulator
MVNDEKNNPLCYMASFIDITEKNRNQEELKKEKESAERYLNLAGSIILALDTKGKIVLINKKGHEILGYKTNEIIGKNWFDNFIPKDNVKELKKVFSELIRGKTKSVEHYVNSIVTRKGDLKLIRWYNTILRDSSGNINAILSSGEDITDYKKAEQEIVQTKDYLQSIINSASEIIISVDKNLKVNLWNKTSELLTGLKQKQIIGKPIDKANIVVNFEELKLAINLILKEKTAKFDELVLITNRGDKKIIRCSLSAIKGNENQIKGALILGRDITRDIGAHGKLIQGNSYLIYDKTNNSSVDLLIDITRSKYQGFFITRYKPDVKHDVITSPNIDVAFLSYQKINNYDNVYDLNLLERKIEEFCKKHRNSVVLLDRVDFLISNFSFDNFIKSLYRINNIIVDYKSILLIHLIPELLDKKQQTIIEQECQFLPSQKIEDIQIDDSLFSILKYVYAQSANNAVISYKKISSQFSIVRATTNKRLKILEDLGLLHIKKQGRLKTLHLTEKGKTLLKKRITL